MFSDTESGGIWGREEYEGKLLSQLHNVRLHIFKAAPQLGKPIHLAGFIHDCPLKEREELISFLKSIPEGKRAIALETYQNANNIVRSEKLDWKEFYDKFKSCVNNQVKQPVFTFEGEDFFLGNRNAIHIFNSSKSSEREKNEFNSINGILSSFDTKSDMEELNELIADTNKLFIEPKWEIIDKTQQSNTKDIYIALYPGHFFPLFKKK